MIRLLKKIGILFGIFAVVLVIYIAANRERLLEGDVVYTMMEKNHLPMVYVEMSGREMNPMQGYRQDMGNAVARDSLTILPQDRALKLHAVGGQEAVTGIRYEIRSLDLQRLVENTVLEDWQQGEDGLRAVLPIQNLLTKEQEYLLRLELDTEESGTVYYYTRIVWSDSDIAQSMIDLACDFSSKTFHYDEARALVTYLESDDTGDNSSFGRTTIRSSFSQLTWGHLGMQPVGQVRVKLKELDGIMGCVSLTYLVQRQTEEGRTETYQVGEDFTMKWNAVRTYLMDYERKVDQIFEGNREDYSGKRILLGITNEQRLDVESSPDGRILAYRVNRALWSYDQKSQNAVRIFSFRDSQDVEEPDLAEHDIRILHVDDNGDVDFLVYGYQSRGSHEGQSGIVGYHYEKSDNALQERFFIPSTLTYAQLEQDLEQLTYRASGNMLYIYLDHAIYGIDMTSNENMVVADALQEGSFAVSADKARIAWHEGGTVYQSRLLHLMDLETGDKLDIHGQEDEYVRALGFVGRDLVYGLAKETDPWIVNGRIIDLPMQSVEILNDRMQVETRYEKSGYYVASVTVEESRIHLNRVTRIGEQSFAPAQEDTIVCNAEMGPGSLEGIGWYASQDKERVYFVQMSGDNGSGRNVRVTAPRQISYDHAEVLELKANTQLQGLRFYAYGGGKLLEVTENFSKAVSLAYDRMGIVTDQNQRILWSRVNRDNAYTIRDLTVSFAQAARHLKEFDGSKTYSDEVTLLDARGCSVTQILYFIGQGIPVVGYTGEGEYLVLYGFDQYNVSIYNPETGETYKAGLNDSTEYYRRLGNDFVCAVAAR